MVRWQVQSAAPRFLWGQLDASTLAEAKQQVEAEWAPIMKRGWSFRWDGTRMYVVNSRGKDVEGVGARLVVVYPRRRRRLPTLFAGKV